jgi:hypothetical protein
MIGKKHPTNIKMDAIAHINQSLGFDSAMLVSTRSRIAKPKKK